MDTSIDSEKVLYFQHRRTSRCFLYLLTGLVSLLLQGGEFARAQSVGLEYIEVVGSGTLKYSGGYSNSTNPDINLSGEVQAVFAFYPQLSPNSPNGHLEGTATMPNLDSAGSPFYLISVTIGGQDVTNTFLGTAPGAYTATYSTFIKDNINARGPNFREFAWFYNYYYNPEFASKNTIDLSNGATVQENGDIYVYFDLSTTGIVNRGPKLTLGSSPTSVDYLTIKGNANFPCTDSNGNPISYDAEAEIDANVTNVYLTTPPNHKELGDASTRPGGADVGDPVDVVTGNVYRTVTDYESHGRNELTFARYYNSLQTTLNSAPGARSLGTNWRSTYDRYLYGTNGTIYAERPDGQVLTFTLERGTWISDTDVNAKLVQMGANWTLTTGDDSVETYGPSSGATVLQSIRFRDGYTQTLTYNTSNQLSVVGDTNSRSLSFTYYANGLLHTVTMPDNQSLTYAYGSSGTNGTALDQLTSITFPTSPATSWTYKYGEANYPFALTEEDDELGDAFTTWQYDGTGRCIVVSQADNANNTQITYNTDGSRTVTNALGQQEVYKLGSFQGVEKVIEIVRIANDSVPAASEVISYDTNGYVASVKDWGGVITRFSHDNRGNVLKQVRAAGTKLAETTIISWHPLFHLPLEISKPSDAVRFGYDASGNLVRRTESPSGQSSTWTWTYNSQGEVLTAMDPNHNVTTYGYDTQNNLASITDPLQHTTTITQTNANGFPLQVIDPNALATTFTCDTRGNLTSRTVGTEKTAYDYDAANNLARVIRPDGSFLTFTYDNAHRLVTVTDPLGNRINYTLDDAGNRTETDIFDHTGALVRTKNALFDPLSRLAQEVGAAQSETTTYAYNPTGDLVEIVDPLSHSRSRAFDALHRLTKVTDALGGVVTLGFDPSNRLTSVADPRSLKTLYTYTGRNQVAQVKSPDTGLTTKSYDGVGNLKRVSNGLGGVLLGYDGLNRLTSEGLLHETVMTFAYDEGGNGVGHMTSMSDLKGDTKWSYDSHGRVVSKSQRVGLMVLGTAKSYDSSGRLSTLTYPSGHVVSYQYDPQSGLLSAIKIDGQSVIGNIVYTPFGPVASWSQGNGDTYARSFDKDGRITGISVQGQSGGNSQSFTYDPAGRIVGSTDSLAAAPWVFGYDDLNRLSSVSGDVSEAFTYDGSENRLSVTAGGDTTLYKYPRSNNWLASSRPGQKNKFNRVGELLSDGLHSFTYDTMGQMTSALSGKSVLALYVYNGLGQRVEKFEPDVAGGTRFFAYDDGGALLGEYDPSAQPIQETIWLDGLPVAVLENGAIYYVNPDQIGAPHMVTDQQGGIVWQWVHEPFGKTDPVPAADFVYNLRFPGQYADSETYLNYNMARSYAPTLGRYIESDPIGIKGGFNTFTYVGGNPMTRIDSNGLQAAPFTYYELRSTQPSLFRLMENVNQRYEDQKSLPDYLNDTTELQADLTELKLMMQQYQAVTIRNEFAAALASFKRAPYCSASDPSGIAGADAILSAPGSPSPIFPLPLPPMEFLNH